MSVCDAVACVARFAGFQLDCSYVAEVRRCGALTHLLSLSLPRLRFQPPDQLPQATAFSCDETVRGSLNVVELLKSQAWLYENLSAACNLGQNWGRPCENGDWLLAMVAFVVSGQVDIMPWHDQSTPDLRRACRFSGKPPCSRVYRRLRELECCEEALLDGIGQLVRRARAHDSRVGAHVHIDGTEDETHAALIHDCQPGENCPYRERRHRAARRGAQLASQRRSRDVTGRRETPERQTSRRSPTGTRKSSNVTAS